MLIDFHSVILEMNKNIPNVTSLVIRRETHANRRHNGLASKDLLGSAEEKAASCAMEEIVS